MKMVVPAMKLHPHSYSTRSNWALHLTRVDIQRRISHHQSTVVCCSTATTTATSNSSSDEPETRLAMSKADLESCQWLRPSEKTFVSESSAFRTPFPPVSASDECCFSLVGASRANGSVKSSHGSSAQPSSLHSSEGSAHPNPPKHSVQPSSSHSSADGPAHPNPPKHSSVLLNALPVSRLLDAAFSPSWTERAENGIERVIFDFRFLSLLAVAGSLAGSFLCFLKGCVFIVESYAAFYAMCLRGEHTGKMVLRLVEAVDVYLTGTVMLIFGMGLYGLFISNVAHNIPPSEDRALRNSSLFGMFLLQERPKWMRIASLDELKTKLGHVVVMILLVKMFERSKAVVIATGADLLSYSISIFLTSGALLVLRHLHQ